MNSEFGDITGDIEIPSGELRLSYTVAGNSGSIIYESDRIVIQGLRYSYYLSRTQEGEDIVTTAILDRRSIETQARFSLDTVSQQNHPRPTTRHRSWRTLSSLLTLMVS